MSASFLTSGTAHHPVYGLQEKNTYVFSWTDQATGRVRSALLVADPVTWAIVATWVAEGIVSGTASHYVQQLLFGSSSISLSELKAAIQNAVRELSIFIRQQFTEEARRSVNAA